MQRQAATQVKIRQLPGQGYFSGFLEHEGNCALEPVFYTLGQVQDHTMLTDTYQNSSVAGRDIDHLYHCFPVAVIVKLHSAKESINCFLSIYFVLF
jgi:hypothetical protein